MTTSPASAPSRPLSRSEYVSTLPPWRRLLAILNWRPVYDIEQRTKQHELNVIASEKRMQESEKRLKLLKLENKRLANSSREWMPCCSMPIPPRRHLPQPAPTERGLGSVARGVQTAKGLIWGAMR